MSLNEQLISDMKQAMREKEAGRLRLSVIRMVRAAVKNKEIELQKELSDTEIQNIIAREVKMRREALADFQRAGRADLIEQTEQEIAILTAYLPQQLSEAEVRQLVQQVIAQTGAQTEKDLGRVMAALMPAVKGRADGKMVNALVRQMLSK